MLKTRLPLLSLFTEEMAEQQSEKKPFQRLPVDVVPINYKVELKPDLQAFTFQGKLEITIKVV